ncbi:MAG: hypothetical protein HRU69_12170 [Flammeovirgaceae bacterium]|nr:MAG: hypothetical protein HRU69_12170 [Flammeovirgaceae bacterium]
MKLKQVFIFLLSGFVGFVSSAQDPKPIEAELAPVEVEIVRERKIVLPEAVRLFEKIPPRPAEPIKPEITYEFRSFQFSSPMVNSAIRPFKLKDEETDDIYGGFISAGYGNYASPYLEAFVNSKRDKTKLLGAHAFLNSSGKGPVDGRNSGSGNSGLSVFARSFGNDVTYQARAGFENQSTHFYGYPQPQAVERDTIRQSFNLFSVELGLANARNTQFDYNLNGNFSFLSDKFNASESTLDLAFAGSYKVSELNRINVQASYAVMSRKDEGIDAKPRSLFIAKPYFLFNPIDNLRLQAGVVVALENDTLDKKDFHLFPDFKATYKLSSSVDVEGTLTGGVQRVSLQTLVRENLWLAPAVPLYHTNKLFDIQAAVNARLSSIALVHTGISFANFENLYFFVNDTVDVSKFNTVYDAGSTKRTNFFAALTLNYSDVARFMLRGDYFSYSTDELPEAWHRPGYRATVSGSYNIRKKVLLRADIIAQGNMKALDPATQLPVKLDPAFDLNFRTEYFVSKNFSVFVDLNNITSNKYPVFLNYPVRGFQVMGGITWSF